MILELGRRLGLSVQLESELKREVEGREASPEANGFGGSKARHAAACLAKVLFTVADPCGGAVVDNFMPQQTEAVWRRWLSWARASSCRAVSRSVQTFGDPAAPQPDGICSGGRFALHYKLGNCGMGPFMHRAGRLSQEHMGWDRQLALLTCLLGRRTIIFSAAPSGQGLLHQELVDFDFPNSSRLLMWPSEVEAAMMANGSALLDRCWNAVRHGSRSPCRSGINCEAVRESWALSGKFSLRSPLPLHPQRRHGREHDTTEDGHVMWESCNGSTSSTGWLECGDGSMAHAISTASANIAYSPQLGKTTVR